MAVPNLIKSDKPHSVGTTLVVNYRGRDYRSCADSWKDPFQQKDDDLMDTNSTDYSGRILDRKVYPVTVFLSTPRCGTQWIAKNMNEIYADEVIARHEPVKNEYYPKINMGRYDLPAKPKENPLLNRHLDFIDDTIQNKNYIEVGWQSIAGIDALHKRFGEQMRLIHLYRNPVNVAASMVTHNWYTGKIEGRFEKAELTPFDNAALLKDYKKRWRDLTLYEKSLYYWTEINLRALEIKQRYSGVPFYSLKFENLFEESKEKSRITLIELLSFMGFEYDEKMLRALDIKHDKFQYKTSVNINWKDIYNHPQTMALANKLNYTFDEEINVSRYKLDPLYKRAYREFTSKLTSVFGRGKMKN